MNNLYVHPKVTFEVQYELPKMGYSRPQRSNGLSLILHLSKRIQFANEQYSIRIHGTHITRGLTIQLQQLIARLITASRLALYSPFTINNFSSLYIPRLQHLACSLANKSPLLFRSAGTRRRLPKKPRRNNTRGLYV